VALATGAAIDPDVTVEGRPHRAPHRRRPGSLDTPIADVVAAMADGTLDFAPRSIRSCRVP
jgi:hypothetical protein